jgi:hypothetical protein
MGMPDNPSADKFGPPAGQERFEAPKPRRGPPWFALAFFLALWIARYQLEHIHAKGWMAAAVGLGIVGIAIADYVMRRRAHDERTGGDDPYSARQNITR